MKSIGLEGIIRLTTRTGVTDEDPLGEVTGELEVHNEILNSGLDYLASNSNADFFSRCFISTGTTPVSVTQTGLVGTPIATSTIAPGGDQFYAMTASSPRYNRVVFRRRFAAGSLNGTYSEIGFGPSTGSLFNRALISPTKTVLSTETLDVEYELRTYIPSADVTGTCTIGASSYSYTLRPLDINETSNPTSDLRQWGINPFSGSGPLSGTAYAFAFTGGALAAQTADYPTYTAQVLTSATTTTTPDAYVPGTGYRKVRFAWGLDALNVAGGSFTHMSLGVNCAKWQIAFSPAVPKDSTKTMTLELGVTFSRYTP